MPLRKYGKKSNTKSSFVSTFFPNISQKNLNVAQTSSIPNLGRKHPHRMYRIVFSFLFKELVDVLKTSSGRLQDV